MVPGAGVWTGGIGFLGGVWAWQVSAVDGFCGLWVCWGSVM